MDKDGLFYYHKEIDELARAREIFVKRFPKLAPFLSHDSKDPEIERLIENFAILTSKLHRELDQNIPVIAESLINIVSPNYAAPIPSFSLQEFALSSHSKHNKLVIPKGHIVESTPVNGTKLIFKTVYDVYLYPLKISDVLTQRIGKHQVLSIKVDVTKENTTVSELNISRLNLFFGTDIYLSTTLLMWMFNYLEGIAIVSPETQKEFRIPIGAIFPLGFSDDENVFYGRNFGMEAFSLMQEFFFIPDKFNAIGIERLDILNTFKTTSFIIKFIFNKELPPICLIRTEHLNLFMSPVANIFPISAEPIVNDNKKDGYRIFIDRNKIDHYEILDILTVQAHSSQSGRRALKNYKNFERFEFFSKNAINDFYSVSSMSDLNGKEFKQILLFNQNVDNLSVETISIETLCCNGHLPEKLKINQINDSGIGDVTTKNLTIPTQMRKGNVNGDILWKLVSVFSMNYQTMTSKRAFLSVLQAYDFTLADDSEDNFSRKLSEALLNIKSKTVYRIINGIPKKGTLCIMEIDDVHFYCLGEIYRFGLVASKFLSYFSTINSFCELEIYCSNNKEVMRFFPNEGMKPVI